MNVNTSFKRKILDGHAPALTDPEVEEGQTIVIERDGDGHRLVWITVLKRTKADTWGYSIHWFRPDYMGKASGTTHIPGRAIGVRDQQGAEPERITDKEDHYATEARLNQATQMKVEDEGKRAAKRLADQVRRSVVEVTRAGGDPMILIGRVNQALEAETARQLDSKAA